MVTFRRLTTATLLASIAAAVLVSAAPRDGWRWFKPSLKSQVQNLQADEANRLLQAFCNTETRFLAGIGLTCSVRPLGSAFTDITDNAFHPDGVIFGHFLRPDSEDAAVSGWSAETHPNRWGGTLLLTRQGAKWIPRWYQSALIVHSCEKIMTPEKREILLCEDEDGGMGHQLHYLYSVDLKRVAASRQNPLAHAESFNEGCAEQTQVMDLIHWTEDRTGFSVVLRTTNWRRDSSAECTGMSPKRAPARVELWFGVWNGGVRPL